MNRRWFILGALAAVVAALVWLQISARRAKVASLPAAQAVQPPGPAPDAAPPRVLSVREMIASLLDKMRVARAGAADLAALRAALFADPAAGIAAIREFLATGDDATTGQPFVVGQSGVLGSAPTLRVLLLDLLGQLARRGGSNAAGEVSRAILQEKRSPDEWAMALRNVAWVEPQSRRFLAEKMREMLSYEPWMATPTGGLLEAFDVIVFAGDPTFIPLLTQLAHGGLAPLQRAATVALDRLAESSPLEVMNYLNANPTTIADLPFVRADYFAKANLADGRQRQAVEHYLSRTDVTGDEKRKFLRALAAPGSFVSASLLETSAKPEEPAARAAAIATATTDWLRLGHFQAMRGDIAWLLQRVTLDQ